MKNVILLISAILMLALSAQAQEVVRDDDVINEGGAVSDTLNKDDAVTYSYYVKDFAETIDGYFHLDSLSGSPKVIIKLEGSYNYTKWYEIGNDTVTMTGATFDLRVTERSYKYAYIRATLSAIDNVQNSRYNFNLVIDKN